MKIAHLNSEWHKVSHYNRERTCNYAALRTNFKTTLYAYEMLERCRGKNKQNGVILDDYGH